jgi:predicted dehydrogenase/threonine dehydrogenase-like Zn-dependent dehydrogenase
MKQVLQSLATGQADVVDVPCPAADPGSVLVGTTVSLISAGTERMLVEFGRASWVQKARQQPDKVRQVLEKARTDGAVATLEAVRSKLDQPLAPGYCNVGRVLDVGAAVSGFAVGDRVVSNGRHAECVVVPQNLCARIPDAVADEDAAFTVLGAIALQGVRLVQPTLGEAVCVFGLGLIGLLTVQILRANGCRVLGVDVDPARLELARRFGAETVDLSAGEDPVLRGMGFSRGRGMDAVLLTASTMTSRPVSEAARMSRKRGRIVLVGVTGLELSRGDFYEKELSFQVSCSYGPGRYDPKYEAQGLDYPVGFVRWTEQRNFEAVLDLMSQGRLDLRPLRSHEFDVAQAARTYDLLASKTPSLGILLRYQETSAPATTAARVARTVELRSPVASSSPVVAVIGAGNYSSRVLIPALARTGVRLRTLVATGGVSSAFHGRRFGFEQASTDPAAALDDPDVHAVVIATRHDSHADLARRALANGKHVFVEKPLALTHEQIAQVRAVIESYAPRAAPRLMVGFNRRFSPHVRRMRQLLASAPGPKSFVLTVNAGAIDPTHWTQDVRTGGGRIAGEACHFIDLLRHLAGSTLKSHHVVAMPGGDHPADTAVITLRFADGSVGAIHYLANGHRSYPKERLEVFAAGRVLQLDNFRTLRGFGWPGFTRLRTWRQDKGQAACIAAFVASLADPALESPIPTSELFEVAGVTVAIADALGT